MACSKCGEPGHYASTCGRKTKSTKPSGAKRKAGAAAKRAAAPAPAPAAPPAPLPGGTVLERLRARRAQLVDQLAGAELLRRELQIVEATIELLVESPAFPTVQGSAFEDFPVHDVVFRRVAPTASAEPVEDPDDRHGEVPGA